MVMYSTILSLFPPHSVYSTSNFFLLITPPPPPAILSILIYFTFYHVFCSVIWKRTDLNRHRSKFAFQTLRRTNHLILRIRPVAFRCVNFLCHSTWCWNPQMHINLYGYLVFYIYVRDRISVGTRFTARPDRPWGPNQPLVKWVLGLSRG